MKEKEYTVSTTEYGLNNEKNDHINATASFRKKNSHIRKRKLQALAITIASVVVIGETIPQNDEEYPLKFSILNIQDYYSVQIIPEEGLFDPSLMKMKRVDDARYIWWEESNGMYLVQNNVNVPLDYTQLAETYVYDADGDLFYVLKSRNGVVTSEVVTTKYKATEVVQENGAILFLYTKETPIIVQETSKADHHKTMDERSQMATEWGTYTYVGKNVEAKYTNDRGRYVTTFVYK